MTRTALEQAGRTLFAEQGFLAVSADEIVAAAGVTRGALNYHYGDKRGLFLAVLERMERENSAEIQAAIATVADPGDLVQTVDVGLRVFLEICQRPDMVQIALSDAPGVLGWQAWREFEARHGLGLITAQLEQAQAAGLLVDMSISMLAKLLLSAITEAGLLVAQTDDRAAASAEAAATLAAIVRGLLRSGGQGQVVTDQLAEPGTDGH
ncbi:MULTISPECIES: TetR/AcrR family transcriptional regulator [unclassified Nocardia]|uniref:TetR/AcrR family transcriptional regulator n=1 Tax=unclassified Nocardia TaxID=2637762 RepID=UPI001CE3C5CC|nr:MULTISPECIES: TetR/AcrR family transcriptional regulator [unclassified Nocardia]